MSSADYDFKTIAAISTPPGYGGIGTIRVSGKEALAFSRALLGDSANREFIPNQSTLLQLIDPEIEAQSSITRSSRSSALRTRLQEKTWSRFRVTAVRSSSRK